MNELSTERLRELLMYDADTGHFSWRTRRGSAREGDAAGRIGTDGYLRIKIDRRYYQAHRLAWAYAHGAWPASPIDHINRDRRDNRLLNLRPATWRENQHNKLVRRDSKIGMKGVYRGPDSDRWFARICIKGRRVWLGSFPTPELAAEAYAAAAAVHFGDFSPSRTIIGRAAAPTAGGNDR